MNFQDFEILKSAQAQQDFVKTSLFHRASTYFKIPQMKSAKLRYDNFFQQKFFESPRTISTKFSRKLRNRGH